MQRLLTKGRRKIMLALATILATVGLLAVGGAPAHAAWGFDRTHYVYCIWPAKPMAAIQGVGTTAYATAYRTDNGGWLGSIVAPPGTYREMRANTASGSAKFRFYAASASFSYRYWCQ